MANKKINELDSRATLTLSDLMAVGDPSTGYLYKTTISDLKTLTGAGVISFNGRFGSVVPAEGDYTLTQLSDVIITSASNNQVLRYNGSNWVNASIDLSGYVPYTGATGNVNLGTNTLLAAQIKATSSAGLSINANSGTQIADLGAGGGANMTLFGGLTGTSASFSSSVTGNTIVKTGGTSSQFLKADGSVDSSTYLTTASAASTYVPLTRTFTINGTAYDLSADRTWTIPTHDAVTIGTANGLSLSGQALSLALASTSANGALSSTDWNTFNGKQAALNGTGFVKISGTTISYDNTSYLSLAGGTLTGTLNGTSAVFSSTVQASAYRLTGMTAGAGALYWTSDRVTLANYNATGKVHIEANGGTGVATFGGATYNSDFVGTGRFTGDLYAETGIFSLGLFTSDETKSLVPGGVSSLTTLYVSGDLIVDTNTLYVDSTNNRVGIGTTSPSNKLTISNNGNAAVAFRINDTNANASFLSFNASNTDAALIAGGTSAIPFDIYTGGVARLTVSSGGNVGIGVNPTAWDTTYFRVQELGNSNSRAFVYGRTDTSIEAGIGTNAYYSNAGWKYINTGAASTILFGGNEMLFRIADSGTAGNSLTWNTTMKLTGGKFAFGDSTDWRFNVESSAGGYLLNSHNTRNQSGDVNALFQLGNNANNTSSYFLVCSMPNGDKMYILGNGNVQNINNSYGALSDIKLKENIVDATPKLKNLLKVKIRNYNLIGEQTKQIGVIAQELEEVFPSMVEEVEDFKDVEIIDEDGNITKQRESLGTTTKSVKYSVFVPMLIKAIQEQQAQIEDLKEKIK
jgi:hypothetical protein